MWRGKNYIEIMVMTNGHGNANVYEDALELRPDQRVLGL